MSAAPYRVLRFVFGMLMVAGTFRFLALDWVEDHYVQPVFHFRYFGFSWVPVPSEPILYFLHILLILAALALAFGIKSRISALVVFLVFTWLELIDLAYYLNHYYFVSLACLLFVLVPKPKKAEGFPFGSLPSWSVWMFRLLLGLVYFYAGLAKINPDWLMEALPLKIWLPAQSELPLLGPLFAHPWTPWLFSWAGMLYDTLIPFLLLWSPSRPWAYAAVWAFHLVTGYLFQIGVFPVVMIGATLIFFSAEWHEKRLRQFPFLKGLDPASSSEKEENHLFALWFLAAFFGFQILFPWRFLLYPGNVFWTEQGYRFSWRVMLMEKAGTAQFYVKDGPNGREGEVVNSEFLNSTQEKQMAMQPDMILQFAHFLGDYYQKRGMQQPEVRAEVYVTLNGRPSRLLIDPHRNLLKEEDTWKPKPWILPDR